MQTLSVAAAKARLSAVLAQVEAGEEIVITRRGVAIARIVAEPAARLPQFDMAELFTFVDGQPMHVGADAGQFVGEMRGDACF
ncbi:type II toxin-antitoxin system prevent-host-death family antitoxin [uncultured Lamprocystis sp.]|jgi:prevent-host-death family protein|uniref:type II toxin-antitoxin system Phd/YefM family antitoxin n=1 Tax=uncultured Lamprocystis sp. TaxID=543132 RepID=UPI003425EA36